MELTAVGTCYLILFSDYFFLTTIENKNQNKNFVYFP